MAYEDVIDAELAELLRQTGIDLSPLPPIMTTKQLASALEMSEDALTQERYRAGDTTIPFIKLGRKVRYLRADVARHLVTHRNGGDGAA
jgi:hypothetical protein